MLEKKNSQNIDIKALSSKKKVTDALATLVCQIKLLKYQENIWKQHKRENWNQNIIVSENFKEKLIEALVNVESNVWYVLCLSDRYI